MISTFLISSSVPPVAFRRVFGAIVVFAWSIGAIGSGTAVRAERPHFQFTRALQERGWNDTALDYLKMLTDDPSITRETKDRIPFEQASIHLAMARLERSASAKNTHTDQAMTLLRDFLDRIPEDHPLAGEANAKLADILLVKATIAKLEADDPANETERTAYLKTARELITQAREILTKARDQYQAEFDAFPTYIAKSDRQKYEARKQAETNLLRAKLELAKTYYEEARTYDESETLFGTTLRTAAEEFEKVHTRHRSMLVGLYARMWMGKCFEERGDIGTALGFYNELLSHPGKSAALARLQDQVQQFRLICLNHPKRKDYVLAYQEADRWLQTHRSQVGTLTGLGIRWEKARSAELLGVSNALPAGVIDFIEMTYRLSGIEETIPRGEQSDFYNQALSTARELATIPGVYQQPAQEMVRRLEGILNQTGGDPQDFNTADSLSQGALRKALQLQKQIRAGSGDERKDLIAQFTARVAEGENLSRIGLNLATEKTPETLVQDLRKRLGFFYYLQTRYHEAAAVANFVSRTAPLDSGIGLEAGALEMACWVKLLNEDPNRPISQRQFELDGIIAAADHLTSTWPESERAIDAHIQVGEVFRMLRQEERAAESFVKVPESAPQYADAQIRAGQAYFYAYTVTPPEPAEGETEDDHKAHMIALRDQARQHLQTGIDRMTALITEQAAPPAQLTAARLSLVQLLVENGEHSEALKLLTEGNHAVIEAVQPDAVIGENFDPNALDKRPDEGVKSRAFAGLAHQMLLRCYIATKQIDKAQGVMTELETIYGGSGSQELFDAYEDLGRQLQLEMQRLVEQNETERLTALRESFDLFLGRLYEGRDKLPFGSLVWIGETYRNLGQGALPDRGDEPVSETDRIPAKPYFEKAVETYRAILDRSGSDPNFLKADQIPTVKLYLARSERNAGQFADAEATLLDVLEKQRTLLPFQWEMATLLQEWGNNSPAEATEKFESAMGNNFSRKKKPVVWGWNGLQTEWLAIRNQLVRNGEDTGTEYEQARNNHLEAFLNYLRSSRGKGLSLGRGEQAPTLERTGLLLENFVESYGPMPDEWYANYNGFHHKLQDDLGQTHTDLPRIVATPTITSTAPEDGDGAEGSDTATETTNEEVARNDASAEDDAGLPMWVYLVVAVLMAGGVIYGTIALAGSGGRRSSRGRSRSRSSSSKSSPKKSARQAAGAGRSQK